MEETLRLGPEFKVPYITAQISVQDNFEKCLIEFRANPIYWLRRAIKSEDNYLVNKADPSWRIFSK